VASDGYQEAVAQVTAPGQRYETAEVVVGGQRYIGFRHAPPSLRELLGAARAHGEQHFLVYEDERWTFADVMAHVDALARALVDDLGIRRGDRVAIAMRNYPEWVVSFAAITSIGAIAVALNAWWTADELDYVLEDCEPAVLIGDAERVERAGPSCERRGIAVVVVRAEASGGVEGAVGADAGDLPAGARRWEDLVRPGPGVTLPDVEVGPDDDATILYTSGTTGRPKGAVSTHRALVHALMAFGCRVAVDVVRRAASGGDAQAATTGPARRPVLILVVPLFHVTGLVPVMLGSFISGNELVMMYRWDPERALELIERERVTSLVGVPTQSWDLLESPRFGDFDTSSLASVGGGGAPMPPQMVERLDRSFARGRPSIGYGMTETNAYGPGHSGDDLVRKPTSTGRAVPVMQVEIRDPDGRALATGEVGEIWLRGPNLFRGYWRRPEATAEALVDGWLRTGDVGRVDDEGFLYIQDRLKDMILRGGENVYCAEVEAALYEHPDVHEAAAFGVPHERLGEEVAAAVVPRAGAVLTADDLVGFLRDRLAAFKVPTRWILADAPLPRSATGKILKRQLRDRL
jgi:long-chain acyl-CoA synthetase